MCSINTFEIIKISILEIKQITRIRDIDPRVNFSHLEILVIFHSRLFPLLYTVFPLNFGNFSRVKLYNLINTSVSLL